MTYERKCPNWLATFRDWSLPRSESPESYHLWAGLFTLASCLKRQVRVPKAVLGGWEVSPTLFVVFIAPPGKAHKSTSAGYAEDLLVEIPTVNRVATSITKEKLLEKLASASDSSLSIFSSEFAMFIQKSGFDMYDVLTHLFDANRDVSVETLGRQLDFASKPCVNLLACTTPGWVADNMPEHVIGGGFASRVIFVYEERSRRRKLLFGKDEIKWDEINEMRRNLVEDLVHISTLTGDFSLTDEAFAFVEDWYDNLEIESSKNDFRLQGYFERKPAHMFKLAMLFHVSYSDELVLNIGDIQAALGILEELEVKLPRTFANIGKNPYSVDMSRMIEFIGSREKVTKRELLANFYQSADPRKLEELIQGLLDMGKVRMFVDKDDPHNKGKTILQLQRNGMIP